MDTALIVVGILLLGILLMWAFAYMSDPKEIDEAEEAEVRDESPQERERAMESAATKSAGSNAADIEFYSHGDPSDE